MSIAEYLADARRWHQVYRDNLPRRVPNGSGTLAVQGDTLAAGLALYQACRARVEAHTLDPQQTDPAWRDEPVTHDHDALLSFYGEQLAR